MKKIERHGTALLSAMLLTLAAVSSPSAARAEDPTLYGGSDWFMSAYGMFGVDNADTSGGQPSGGATVTGGFRFNRWLAAEVGGEWAARFKYDQGSGPITCRGEGGGASSRFTAWQVSGGGRSCMGTGFMTRIGGGVDVFVTNGLAVSLLGAYVWPMTGKSTDHDYISFGLGLTWY